MSRITVSFPPELRARVQAYAAELGISEAAVIRQLVASGMDDDAFKVVLAEAHFQLGAVLKNAMAVALKPLYGAAKDVRGNLEQALQQAWERHVEPG